MFEAQESGDGVEAEVARLVGLLNATTARLVAVMAEVLATGAWEQAGMRSPAHWLAWKAGMSPRRARRLVALARRAEELPVTTAAFGAGSLSEDQVTEIARHVPAAHDAELAELAQLTTVSQLQKVARSYTYAVPPTPQDEPAPPPTPADAEAPNEVRFRFTEDGRWELRADVDAALGALVQRALEACRSAVFHERHPEATAGSAASGTTWADGLRRLAETSLVGLLGERRPGESHQVILHVRAHHDDRPTWLHLGPALPAAQRRLLSCDAVVRYLVEDAEGVPIKLGRKQHTIPPRVRTIVEDRDRQCRGPGCTQARWLEAHHVVHWEDGGETDPANLVLLCGHHHRLHHQGMLGISGDGSRPDGLLFTDRSGRVLAPGAGPAPPDPASPLDETATGLGLPPPEWTHPTGERLDPWWITFRDPPEAA